MTFNINVDKISIAWQNNTVCNRFSISSDCVNTHGFNLPINHLHDVGDIFIAKYFFHLKLSIKKRLEKMTRK